MKVVSRVASAVTAMMFLCWAVCHARLNLQSCPGGQVVPNIQCCKWFDVLGDLQKDLFNGGKCDKGARSAIRLTFHDSIGRSQAMQESGVFGGGGAGTYGSIIKYAGVELAYRSNSGLDDIVNTLKTVADHHHVSYGDIIQFAGAAGLANCPGAPRLQFLTGRPEATAASPPELVPMPVTNVTVILSRMRDAGFTVDDTVALLAAHSIGLQETIDPTIPGTPLDSTPHIFDNRFYLETLRKGTAFPGGSRNKGEAKSSTPQQFRLASDDAIARDSRTASGHDIDDNEAMKTAFHASMMKIANNGQDVDSFIDCSDVIPIPEDFDQTSDSSAWGVPHRP